MKQIDSLVRTHICHRRPLRDEHNGSKACNDADPCPTLRTGVHRVFNLILWVLYTGMQWKCLPVPQDTAGKPAIHYTTVYRVFAKWADDGSLWQAFVASVAHLAKAKQLDLSILHGDGTNTVAKKGGMALAIPATSTKRARKSSPSSTTMGMS